MQTYGLREAAKIARVHFQTLREKAASKSPDRPPGTKIGREWVFPVHLFDAWIESKCLSTNDPGLKSGGAVGQSLATRIEKRREQLIAKRLKNSKKENASDSGDSTN
jgi:hypothetical protein